MKAVFVEEKGAYFTKSNAYEIQVEIRQYGDMKLGNLEADGFSRLGTYHKEEMSYDHVHMAGWFSGGVLPDKMDVWEDGKGGLYGSRYIEDSGVICLAFMTKLNKLGNGKKKS